MEHLVNDFSSFENNTMPPNKTIDPMVDLSNPDIETPLIPDDHVPIKPDEQEKSERGELVYDLVSEIFEDIVLPSDEEMREMMLLLEDVVDVVANPLESSEGENELPSHDLGDAPRAKVEEKPASGKRTRTSWTTEEHSMFLLGLRVHGKGKWKIISRDFIPTKTPIQIASHAQKYFNHQKPHPKGKKHSRPSIHDIRNINPLVSTLCLDNMNMLPYTSNIGVLDHGASESRFNITNRDTAASYNFHTSPGSEGEEVASNATPSGPSTSFGPFSF